MLIPCPDDDDFVLVTQAAVEYVEMPGTAASEDDSGTAASGTADEEDDSGTAASEDGSGTVGDEDDPAQPPPPPQMRILSRPQAGNGQMYFDMLHHWAGRKAGGFGRPAGYEGRGTWAQHVHRFIPPVLEQFGTTCVNYHVYIGDLLQLFDQWLHERHLSDHVIRAVDGPQFPPRVDDRNMSMPTSFYYRVQTEIPDPADWIMNFHGTYFYTLWCAVTEGLRPGGVPGEGGDNHVAMEADVYTTPTSLTAYGYACPQQLFGNGFLMRVVLDVRVQRRFMHREFNRRWPHKWECLYHPEHTKVAGFWLFPDSHAALSDSRLLEWDPLMESIPQCVVDNWVAEGENHETKVPRVITDPNPMFPPLSNLEWTDRPPYYFNK